MDIGMIIPKLDSIGGGEKFFLECLSRWQIKNDVTVYTTSFDEELLKEFQINANVELIKPIIKNPSLSLMTLPLEMKKLGNKIGKHDVYNPHLFPTNLIKNKPSVWCPQEPPRMLYDLKKYLMKRNDISLFRKLLFYSYSDMLKYINDNYTTVNEIVANSYYTKNYLENVYKKNINHVVYPGVDWENFKFKKGKENVILVVNRLFPEKRVDLAIKSMEFLDDYMLWIVGEGVYLNTLKKLVLEMGLEKRVKFWGKVSEKKLIELYSECFCTVFTPLREPFGMVALESMAAGKPVIGCKEGGFTEIMEDGVHGFLIDPDPKKIAEKIIYLYENSALYEKMRKECRIESQKYSWDATSENLYNILSKLS